MNAEDITQLYREKNYALAEKEAKAALQLDPNNVHLLYIFALIMSAQMQFAPALSACLRILKQEPHHAYALSALVTNCVQLGLPDIAEAHIQRYPYSDAPTTQSWLAGLYGGLAICPIHPGHFANECRHDGRRHAQLQTPRQPQHDAHLSRRPAEQWLGH